MFGLSRRGAVALGIAMMSAFTAAPAFADTHACVEAAHEGQRLRDGGKLGAARDAFVVCSAAACPAVVRDNCVQWVGEIEALMPTIVIGARDSAGADLIDVRVSLDGKELTRKLDGRSVAVDPGPHELVFEAERFAPVRQSLLAREGEKARAVNVVFTAPVVATTVPLTPPPPELEHDGPDHSNPYRPAVVPVLIAGGVALLGAAGFTIFGLSGQSAKDDLDGTCASSKTCRSADVDAARTKLIVADVSLAIGVVALGVVGALLIAPLFKTQPKTTSSSSSWTLKFGSAY